VDNQAGGVISAPTTIDLGDGTLRNAGALQVGGTGTVGRTVLTGNLSQSGTGRLVIDADLAAGTADRLEVQGTALVGGTVEVRPISIANAAVTVLTGTGGLATDPALSVTRTHLFRFDLQQAGGGLQLRPGRSSTPAPRGWARTSSALPRICRNCGTAARASTRGSPRSAVWPTGVAMPAR
jgi:hypothetical protein